MALTVDKLINDDRFSGDNVIQFLLYLPFGLMLLVLRTMLGLILWVAAIILPDKYSVRQLLSILACCTFGVYVKLKGKRDPRSSLMVANYVSALDSLAASHALGTISLRKWKVPPFFASTLGIRSAAQFARKQHFAESPSKPVLLQPEGGPTNGRGLLKFTDWPFQIGNRVQPVAITVERMFTNVTVHRSTDSADKFPWSDTLWFLWTPVTVYTVQLLPALDRGDDDDSQYIDRIRQSIAGVLNVEPTEFRWERLRREASRMPPSPTAAAAASSNVGSGGSAASSGVDASRRERSSLQPLAARVKEVLPAVPMQDILRDLGQTRSVDWTITNFLEGVTPYTPEESPTGASPPACSSRSSPSSSSSSSSFSSSAAAVFSSNAKERELSFQERKAQMIAAARRRYLEKQAASASASADVTASASASASARC